MHDAVELTAPRPDTTHAGGAPGSDLRGAGGGLAVQIVNTATPAAALEVRLVPAEGASCFLGAAPPNEAALLPIPGARAGSHRLVAVSDDRAFVSTPFDITAALAVAWTVRPNEVHVAREGA